MLHIAVCDDQAVHREHTADLVRRELWELEMEVDCYGSAQALLLAMSAGDYAPDIAVLDIQMDGMDGLELAKRLNELAPQCRIIFLTSFLDFATEVYSAEHVYFIVKSQVKQRIGPALDKALATMPSAAARPLIYVRGRQGTAAVDFRQLLYLERRGRQTCIVTLEGEELSSQSPAELLEGISDRLYLRCHQSFWVNTLHISALGKDEFVLDSGHSVPISRSFKAQAKARFFKLLTK